MKFTQKHDQIIISAIKKKPYNLQEAFRDATREIGICYLNGYNIDITVRLEMK